MMLQEVMADILGQLVLGEGLVYMKHLEEE